MREEHTHTQMWDPERPMRACSPWGVRRARGVHRWVGLGFGLWLGSRVRRTGAGRQGYSSLFLTGGVCAMDHLMAYEPYLQGRWLCHPNVPHLDFSEHERNLEFTAPCPSNSTAAAFWKGR